MKAIVFILLMFPSLAYSFEPKIENFIGQYSAYNLICRGSSFPEENTVKIACKSRDVVYNRLIQEGYQFGHDDQPMFERKWEKVK